MATAVAEAPEMTQAPSLRDRVVDAYRQAGHLSHEAWRLKTAAEDAIEDSVYAAKRAVKSMRRQVEGLGDEAAHRVRQQPLQAVGVAVGIGAVVGLAVGLIATHNGRRV